MSERSPLSLDATEATLLRSETKKSLNSFLEHLDNLSDGELPHTQDVLKWVTGPEGILALFASFGFLKTDQRQPVIDVLKQMGTVIKNATPEGIKKWTQQQQYPPELLRPLDKEKIGEAYDYWRQRQMSEASPPTDTG